MCLMMNYNDLLEESLCFLKVGNCFLCLSDFPRFEVENSVSFFVKAESQIVFESQIIGMLCQLVSG